MATDPQASMYHPVFNQAFQWMRESGYLAPVRRGEAGFIDVAVRDSDDRYRDVVVYELATLNSERFSALVEPMGAEQADYLLDDGRLVQPVIELDFACRMRFVIGEPASTQCDRTLRCKLRLTVPHFRVRKVSSPSIALELRRSLKKMD